MTPQGNHTYEYYKNRQDWAIDRWCRDLKISRKKLEQHPHIEDVATLLMFDHHDSWFNQEDQRIWTHCWQWCYHQERALSQYHKSKLIKIIEGIEFRRQAFGKRQLKRQHIQARIERRKLAAV